MSCHNASGPADCSSALGFSKKALRTKVPAISTLLQMAIEDPEILSLAAGLVDQKTLPDAHGRALVRELFDQPEEARAALQYGMTSGLLPLREAVATRLERLGLPGPVDPEHIVIGNGSQQLLHLIAEATLDPGDLVLVEDPTYFVMMGVLESAGARILGVKTDENGVIPEALEERLRGLERQGLLGSLKLVFFMSYYQNPAGMSISLDRRERVVEILDRFSRAGRRPVLIEDAAYRELRIEGPDLPYLKTYDPQNRWIALTGTFSKAFAPGFRLGWGYLPPALRDPAMNLKGNEDFGSSNLNQTLMARALRRGLFDQQMEHMRDRYRQKRDLLLKAVREHWPPDVSYYHPKGGLYVWAKLPEGVSSAPGSPFFNECLARKVIYVPGAYCYCMEPEVQKPENDLRLCYGYIEDEPMIEAVRRMGEAIAAVLERQAV